MPGRTSLKQVLLFTLFALVALVAAERVLAVCVTPQPVLPLDPGRGDSDPPSPPPPPPPRPGPAPSLRTDPASAPPRGGVPDREPA